jgi:hypothetical protein
MDERTKVFGVGGAKTGVTSLGQALRTLGYKHQYARLDLVMDVRRGDLQRAYAIVDEKHRFQIGPGT